MLECMVLCISNTFIPELLVVFGAHSWTSRLPLDIITCINTRLLLIILGISEIKSHVIITRGELNMVVGGAPCFQAH